MAKHNFKWGYINIFNANIAEIIIDEGVHFNQGLQDEIIHFLDLLLPGGYSVLFNRTNCYTFDYNLRALNTLDTVHHVAVVLHDQKCLFFLKCFMALKCNSNFVFKVFATRSAAINYIINTPTAAFKKPAPIKKAGFRC